MFLILFSLIFKQLRQYQKINLRKYNYIRIFTQATIKNNLMNELQKLAEKYEAQIAQKKELRKVEPREFDQICLTQEIVTLQTVVVDIYTSIFNLHKQN